MAKFKVVLIDQGYGTSRYEQEIITAAGGEFIDADKLPLTEKLRLCEEAEGIVLRRLTVTAELIKRFHKCKIIVRCGVGTDNVDVKAATEAGIIVGHVPAYCVDEVSTHAIALLLGCVRKIVSTHRQMEQGAWDVHRTDPIYRLAGKTLGLVGFGNIGQAVARKLAGWELKLLATDPFVDPARAKALSVSLVDLDRLCREADYASLHVPLLPETQHLIGERTLRLMRRGAIVINTARGQVADGEALLAAVESGQLGGAGLDVFEEEPLPPDSPLRRHPRIIVTDHTAWYSEESQVQLQTTAAQEIVRVCTGGLPDSLANPEVLRRLGRFAEWTPGENVRWQLKRMETLGIR